MHRPVFLTGMMGSGKSTIGRMLAEERGAVFIDLDRRIESLLGTSIPALFAAAEGRFRACETLALSSLIAEPAFAAREAVVATGGGVVIRPENRRLMREAGLVVFLDVPVDQLTHRLEHDDERAARPLVAEAGKGLRGRLAELLAARRQAYLDGSIVVDGGGAPDVVLARLLDATGSDGDVGAGGTGGRRGTQVG
jgi:shikimate kinase